MIPALNDNIGCYVHIPFCVRKCAYCDFNSYSGYNNGSVARYVDALEREIRSAYVNHQVKEPVDTIFFGGGTPTAIPASDEIRLLKALQETLPLTDDVEITTEANPGTADIQNLTELRKAGFNRISFGVQSFDSSLLKTLDRIHTAGEARNAVRAAREAGFENISIDLMFALPNQTVAQWRDTLDQAIELETDHIALYSLIVEEGTGFYTLYRKGRLPLPDEDTSATMYQMAIDTAREHGYDHYEISNFAKQGRKCRHNIHYWRNDPYFGFGCGATAYIDNVRRTNIKSPAKYAETINAILSDSPQNWTALVYEQEQPDLEMQMSDTMMLGLRMPGEGVDRRRFTTRYGIDPCKRYSSEMQRFIQNGLLEADSNAIRLTPKGIFLGNEVMAAFI